MGRLLAQEAVSYSDLKADTRHLAVPQAVPQAIARLFDEANQQGYQVLNWRDPRP